MDLVTLTELGWQGRPPPPLPAIASRPSIHTGILNRKQVSSSLNELVWVTFASAFFEYIFHWKTPVQLKRIDV